MKILSGVCLILGCFLGAGFVSGKEISSYFSRFGNISYLSCMLAGVLFFLLTIFFFSISNSVNNSDEFINIYFKKSKVLIEWLFAMCILIVTGAMIAGTSVLADGLGYNKFFIVGATLIFTFFVIKGNVKGLERVNILLVPFLIVVLILTMKIGDVKGEFESNCIMSIVSGCGYIFMNIVSLGFLIIEIGRQYSKKEKLLISTICTVLITCLLLVLNWSIKSNGLIDNIMPNLYLASRNIFLKVSMQISIYVGLFTTLISNVFLLAKFVNKYIKSKNISIIISLIMGLLVSFCGFDNLVGYVYFFIAGVGIVMVFQGVKKSNNKQKSTHNK